MLRSGLIFSKLTSPNSSGLVRKEAAAAMVRNSCSTLVALVLFS